VLWISAPGGAGKTSLASSWIEARRARSLWYQIDEGDADPAAFFYYVTRGGEAIGKSRKVALPALTPAYLPNPAGYVRRYSELLWQKLGSPFVLVLDNYHAVPGESPLHGMLATLVEHLPAGCVLLFLSREAPPAAFARCQASPGFTMLGWDRLRLTADEAREIGRARGASDIEQVVALNDIARGWSAGLVLLLRATEEGVFAPRPGAQAPQTLSDYFAGEILARLGDSEREVLLKLSIPTRVTLRLAAELTSDVSAPALVTELNRRRFFTDRVSPPGEPPEFEFHPLLREFLLARAAKELPADRLAALRRDAARVFEAEEQGETAVTLWLEAQQYSEAARLICQLAPLLMQQGRTKTIETWITAVPESVRDAVPWLTFWLGASRALFDPAEGIALLSNAYARFEAVGDSAGSLVSCAEVLHAFHYNWRELRLADPWLAAYTRLLGAHPAATIRSLPEGAAIRVIAAGQTLLVRDPCHPLLPRLAELAEEQSGRAPSADMRIHALMLPLSDALWRGQRRRAFEIIDRAALASREASPAPLLILSAPQAMILWQDGQHAAAFEVLDRADALARQSSIVVFRAILMAQRVFTALSAGDLAHAEHVLSQFERNTPPDQIDWVLVRTLRSGLLLSKGQVEAARALLEECVVQAERTGYPFVVASSRVQLGQAMMLEGRHGEAREQLELAIEFARSMPTDYLAFDALLALAYSFLSTGEEEQGLEYLRAAIVIGKRHDYRNCHPWWIPKIMSVLFSRALEAEIEPEYVRRFVRHRELEPDSPHVPEWPWPLRIYTLGQFRVLKDDQPVVAGRKAPRRVLELLQAIVAMGPREVSRERLTEALWPDAEGDTARDAFEIALHRLRKLLGDDTVVLTQGNVSLASRRVWTDIQAFEHLADGIQRGPADGAAGNATFVRATEAALTLYSGHFLANEPERPWMLATRERMRTRFERLIRRAGAYCEESHGLEHAIALYQRAVELDPLAEVFYRRLMHMHARAGRPAEALAIYRRCRHMLSVVLGVAPSPETEALRAALGSHLIGG
jgi:ATP/maltotriose-dependent transcriptional regulator MalT/DNA-binding SARP family transcriptional activator